MAKKHYIIPFFIPHGGCPFDCVFCSQKKITGKEEMVDPRTIPETIDNYLRTFKGDAETVEVAFFGGSFTGIPAGLQEAYLQKAWEAVQAGKVNGIRLSTRPDYINGDILERLNSFGVKTIELGVQSMDDDVLRMSCRGHSSADTARASENIKKYGFSLGLQMMIGLPGDNMEKDIQTAKRISSLEPDFVRIYPTLVVKGTALERMYRKGGYNPLDLEHAVEICEKLLRIFIKNEIEVIRVGLQATDLINWDREVVAGPFHPSFRQLVDSRVLFGVVKDAIYKAGIFEVGEMTIEVNPVLLSGLLGNKKENLSRIRSIVPDMHVDIRQSNNTDKTCIRFVSGYRTFEVDYREMIKTG